MKLFGASIVYDRNELLGRAGKFRAQGRIRKAVREYEKVLAADPRDVEVHSKIAPLYIRLGRRRQAKASLARVIASHEKQGFVDKAIANLRLALSLDRRDLPLRMRLVDLYLEKSLPGDALRLLAGARRTFRHARFLREAIAVEERILGISPDDFRAQVSLVRLLYRAGRRREGGERLQRMESDWASRGNKPHWRKTRWLLFRYAPSPATLWGFIVSLFTSPVP